MLIEYIPKRFSAGSLHLIETANEIIEEYEAMGYILTLRQLYYQFVARDLIANKQSEYKRLGSIINDGRMAGLISWESLEDRTRNVQTNPHWSNPKSIIETAYHSYARDKWAGQNYYLEVWIEKDALLGVIEETCKNLDVSHFSCRGYTSQSEAWGAGQRMLTAIQEGKQPVVIHMGDHDPSGIDMTFDIWKRLNLFVGDACYDWNDISTSIPRERAMMMDYFDIYGHEGVIVERIALNWAQVNDLNPPPNPAKLTDSRIKTYANLFGNTSWELDAIDPPMLNSILESKITGYRDDDLWDAAVHRQEEERESIKALMDNLKGE